MIESLKIIEKYEEDNTWTIIDDTWRIEYGLGIIVFIAIFTNPLAWL